MLPTRRFQPGERRPVTFDFTSKLRTGAHLIGTATVSVDPGLTLDGTDSDLGTGLVNAFLKDGIDGGNYTVTCQHNADDGEILMLAMIVEVRRQDL